MSTRKSCNVTPHSRKRTMERKNSDEQSLIGALQSRKYLNVVRRTVSIPWGWILQFVWFGISYLAGLCDTHDGIAALGYMFYNVVFFIYAIVLSIVPGLGIYTLIMSGSVSSSLASYFHVSMANPWMAYAVTGLYVVLGWIIQVVVLIILVVIVLAVIAGTSD